ncbi:MAG: thioredoxin family protein [Pseudomonadota bacterium]|nr:thioredoxin family protein [Pseudomonadota bacterium]
MLLFLALPALAADARLDWRAGVGSVGIVAPGEHVSAEALTTLVVNDVRVELRGDPALVRFPVPSGRIHVEVDVALCTDGSTACRTARFVGEGEVSGKRGSLALAEPSRPTTPAVAATSGVVKVIDFGAVWCPPCNLMEAEVLHVVGATAGLPVDTVDVDRPESWPLKDQYAVGGYPTLVAVDAAGVEVDRLVGYPGPTETRAWFASLGGAVPLDTLATGVLTGKGPYGALTGAAASAAARRLAEGERKNEARMLFAAAADTADLRMARLLVDPQEADARWLFANHAHPGDWVYAALTAAPALWPDAVALVPAVPPVRGADLLYAAAEHAPAETARVLKLSALALLRAALTGDIEKDRGHATFLATMMAETGDVDGALALLDAHAARWPEEFTFVYAAARQSFDAKRLPDAEARARAALAKAWGDQRLRASALLAKVLLARGHKPEAAFVIEAALRELPAPAADVAVRTHRYRTDLETLRAEIRGK